MTIGIRQLWGEAARGRSIRRMLIHETLTQWRGEMRGRVVDLACGRRPAYWKALGLTDSPGVTLTGIDVNPRFRPTVLADLTFPVPLRDHTADVVLSVGFLGMTPRPLELLREIRRVLKPGGTMIVTAPLITPFHPDIHYFRFTERALRFLCREAGFAEATIVPLGGPWTAAAGLLAPFLRPKWLVAPAVYWMSLRLDALVRRLAPGGGTPVTHLVKARA